MTTSRTGSCRLCEALGDRLCDERKQEQRRIAAAIVARVYPSRRFGAPDDTARFRRGLPPWLVPRLVRAVSRALEAPASLLPGTEDELCDYLYVLCVGRDPSLVAVRAGARPLPTPPVRDRYLRVALSSLERVAAVQEVEVRLDDTGIRRAGREAMRLREAARPGVYDEALLPRYRRLVEVLDRVDVRHLDFDVLGEAPAGFDGGAYLEQFGTLPTLLNYLFFPWPAASITTEYLE